MGSELSNPQAECAKELTCLEKLPPANILFAYQEIPIPLPQILPPLPLSQILSPVMCQPSVPQTNLLLPARVPLEEKRDCPSPVKETDSQETIQQYVSPVTWALQDTGFAASAFPVIRGVAPPGGGAAPPDRHQPVAERQVKNEDARKMLLKQLPYENAKEDCIPSLTPIYPGPAQIIEGAARKKSVSDTDSKTDTCTTSLCVSLSPPEWEEAIDWTRNIRDLDNDHDPVAKAMGVSPRTTSEAIGDCYVTQMVGPQVPQQGTEQKITPRKSPPTPGNGIPPDPWPVLFLEAEEDVQMPVPNMVYSVKVRMGGAMPKKNVGTPSHTAKVVSAGVKVAQQMNNNNTQPGRRLAAAVLGNRSCCRRGRAGGGAHLRFKMNLHFSPMAQRLEECWLARSTASGGPGAPQISALHNVLVWLLSY